MAIAGLGAAIIATWIVGAAVAYPGLSFIDSHERGASLLVSFPRSSVPTLLTHLLVPVLVAPLVVWFGFAAIRRLRVLRPNLHVGWVRVLSFMRLMCVDMVLMRAQRRGVRSSDVETVGRDACAFFCPWLD